jgi:hypothetical protein
VDKSGIFPGLGEATIVEEDVSLLELLYKRAMKGENAL